MTRPVLWRFAKVTCGKHTAIRFLPNPLALVVWTWLYGFLWLYSASGDAYLALNLGTKITLFPVVILLVGIVSSRLVYRRGITLTYLNVPAPKFSLHVAFVALLVFSTAASAAGRVPVRAPKPSGGFFFRPPTAMEGIARLALVAMILVTIACVWRAWRENKQLR